jgi:NADH/F420H2 dehydrogenase subunit C
VDLARPSATGAGTGAPSLLAFDRDHINDLLDRLGELEDAQGQPVPARRMNAGVVGLEVPPERLVEVARALRDSLGFEMLTTVSAVDMQDHVESIYHFRAISRNWVVQVRVKLPSEQPEVDSLVGLYPSANWLERECYDMVGIVYRGHPDLRRILLDDEFFGYPLRKSFHQTPIAVHDRATTQVDPERALAGEQQRNVERVVAKRLGQGDEERLHPGTPTFGSNAFYLETGQGVEPQQPEHGSTVETDTSTGAGEKPQRG